MTHERRRCISLSRWAAVPRWTSNPLACNKMYYLDTNAIISRLLLVVREEKNKSLLKERERNQI